MVDPFHVGLDLGQVTGVDLHLSVAAGPEALLDAGVDVAVDFTQVDAARANLSWLAANGVHAVVGTTGFTDADLDGFARAFTRSNAVIAPNFAIGAVLMMRFAELAAPYFETAEIIELHHDHKIDAPSGTALATAERMAAASGRLGRRIRPARWWWKGPAAPAAPVASRCTRCACAGLVAHQEVLLGTTGQTLTIRHDSLDRSSFMPGVVLAVKKVGDRPGLTVGLDALLDL